MSATRTARPPSGHPSDAVVLAFCVGIPALVAVPWITDKGPQVLVDGLPGIAVLALVTLPLLRRAVRAEDDDRLARLVGYAFVAKLLGTLARYYFTFTATAADAVEYHEEGSRLAEAYRRFDLTEDLGRRFIGTGFVRAFTGAVYAVLGSNRLVGFLVFACLSWWGLYFAHRAFQTALPAAERLRYARLVFFLPSLLFWPSSIGKEALMGFALGLVALGVARLVTLRRGGMPILLAGLGGCAIVRPHVALAASAAVTVAFLLRRSTDRRRIDPVGRLVGLAVFILVGSVLLARTAQFFGVADLGSDSIEAIQTETGGQTAQGGSEFDPVTVRTPLDIPEAALTVLFRPFPNEADSLESFLAAAEGVLLLGLLVVGFGRLRSVPGLAVRSPYVAFATVFVGLFVFGFSAIANFGILARQRTQVLPFLLVLLAVPAVRRRRLGEAGPVPVDVSAPTEPPEAAPSRRTAASWRGRRD